MPRRLTGLIQLARIPRLTGQMPACPGRPAPRAARGFTIIELMVVMALIGMLMGASFALFRSMGQTNELDATANEINALFRRARSTSLAQGSRVEIGIELFRNRGVIVSQIRTPVTHFHFEEPTEASVAVGTGRIRAEVSDGLFTDAGRTGRALKLFGSEAGRVETPTDPRFDCPRGVALSCDVFIEDGRGAVNLFRLGTSYIFRINADGALEGLGSYNGQIVLPPAAGETTPRLREDQTIRAVAIQPVPLRRWVHVEMLFDQRGVRMFMDDVEIPCFVEGVETYEELLDRLAGGSAAAEDGPSALLPETWDPSTRMAWVRFLNDGTLDPQVHTQPVELYIERPEEGVFEQAYELFPSMSDALQNSQKAKPFRIIPSPGEPLIIGAGLFGRIDNAQVAELSAGDALMLPKGLVLASQPSMMEVQESDGTIRLMRVSRRKLTIELMGTVR